MDDFVGGPSSSGHFFRIPSSFTTFSHPPRRPYRRAALQLGKAPSCLYIFGRLGSGHREARAGRVRRHDKLCLRLCAVTVSLRVCHSGSLRLPGSASTLAAAAALFVVSESNLKSAWLCGHRAGGPASLLCLASLFKLPVAHWPGSRPTHYGYGIRVF